MFFDTKECEWSDLEIFINGVKVVKATGLKFKKRQEKEHLHASGNEPHSIQRGNKFYEGTLTLLKGAVDNLNDAAVAAGGEDILDIEVLIVCKYKAKGNRLLRTHTLTSVEFTEYELGMIQNDKKQEVALPILFLRLAST